MSRVSCWSYRVVGLLSVGNELGSASGNGVFSLQPQHCPSSGEATAAAQIRMATELAKMYTCSTNHTDAGRQQAACKQE